MCFCTITLECFESTLDELGMASFGTTLVFECTGDLVIVGLALFTSPGFLEAEGIFSAALEKQRSLVMVPTCTIKFGDGGRNTLIEVRDADAMIIGRIAAFHAQSLDPFTAGSIWMLGKTMFGGRLAQNFPAVLSRFSAGDAKIAPRALPHSVLVSSKAAHVNMVFAFAWEALTIVKVQEVTRTSTAGLCHSGFDSDIRAQGACPAMSTSIIFGECFASPPKVALHGVTASASSMSWSR